MKLRGLANARSWYCPLGLDAWNHDAASCFKKFGIYSRMQLQSRSLRGIAMTNLITPFGADYACTHYITLKSYSFMYVHSRMYTYIYTPYLHPSKEATLRLRRAASPVTANG